MGDCFRTQNLGLSSRIPYVCHPAAKRRYLLLCRFPQNNGSYTFENISSRGSTGFSFASSRKISLERSS